MQIVIEKDGDGFLAKVVGENNIFAYGETEEQAKIELLGVVEMMMDYNLKINSNKLYTFEEAVEYSENETLKNSKFIFENAKKKRLLREISFSQKIFSDFGLNLVNNEKKLFMYNVKFTQ